jgi:hypothetical protein
MYSWKLVYKTQRRSDLFQKCKKKLLGNNIGPCHVSLKGTHLLL